MSKWRPEGFVNPYSEEALKKTDGLSVLFSAAEYTACEVGADAILAALTVFGTGCSHRFTDRDGNEGRLSWIPDKCKMDMMLALHGGQSVRDAAAQGWRVFIPDPLPFTDIGDDQETGENDKGG